MNDNRHLYPQTLEQNPALSLRIRIFNTAHNLKTTAKSKLFYLDMKAGQAVIERYYAAADFLDRPGAVVQFGKLYTAALTSQFQKDWIEAAHSGKLDLDGCFRTHGLAALSKQIDSIHFNAGGKR